jgi:SOS-response transcriptional repressor LexA
MLGYAAAGEPLENLDGQDTYYVETDSKYHVDFCITVRGDSMINAGINDGDIVFVRRQPEVENGQVACVEIERSKESVSNGFTKQIAALCWCLKILNMHLYNSMKKIVTISVF